MRRDELGRLVIPLLDDLQRFASWLERSRDADDLVQESLARALDRAHELRDAASLRSWLFRLMHHLCVDRGRGSARRARLVVLEGGMDDLENLSLGNLDGEVLARESITIVEQALRRLSDEHRSVLVLVDVLGFTYEEAAESIEVPVGTIRSRVARARAHLELLVARAQREAREEHEKEGSAS